MNIKGNDAVPSSYSGSATAGQALGVLVVQRLRQLRLTQAELAARCGMPRAYLYRLCRGNVLNPGVLTLHRLARGLQMPTAGLVRLWVDSSTCKHSRYLVFDGITLSGDRMMFLDDVTIPDHTLVLPGERFTKTWAIQNVGEVPWPARRLARCDSEIVIAKRDRTGQLVPLLDAHIKSLECAVDIRPTSPGAVVELSVDFAAPKENCTAASVWRIESPDGECCYGAECFLQVIVTVNGG